MPYIKEDMRVKLRPSLACLKKEIINNKDYDEYLSNLLAYVFYNLCKGFIGDDIRYSKINDIIGALECCKLEACRRLEKLEKPYYGEQPGSKFLFFDEAKALDANISIIMGTAKKIEGFDSSRAGILNYVMTEIFLAFYDVLDKRGLYGSSVFCVSDILNFVKREIYRDIAKPYEDEKIKENGDVYYV